MPLVRANASRFDTRMGQEISTRRGHGCAGVRLVTVAAALALGLAMLVPALSPATASGLGLLAATAHAGTVTGTVRFEPNRLPKPPARNQGFLPRFENPIRPVKRLDPLPYFVVVLEGGPVGEGDAQPTGTVRYELVGESFVVPLLPVVAGTQVELKNLGFGAPMISTPEQPEILEEVVLDRPTVKAFTVTTPYQTVKIRAAGSAHLEGGVVAFPHRYFALVDERGRFEIPNVPPGQWRARIWYRDGWLAGVAQSVDVGAKRTSITLSASPLLKLESK